METLLTFFPTADDLLARSSDDLAPILLKLASRAGPMFWPHTVTEIKQGTGIATTIEHAYPFHKRAQIDALLGETWERLHRDGLIMPAPDQNGRNGYIVLTNERLLERGFRSLSCRTRVSQIAAASVNRRQGLLLSHARRTRRSGIRGLQSRGDRGSDSRGIRRDGSPSTCSSWSSNSRHCS